MKPQFSSTCLRKKMFTDLRQAEYSAKKFLEKNGFPLYVYRCEECIGWHLSKIMPHVQSILEAKK